MSNIPKYKAKAVFWDAQKGIVLDSVADIDKYRTKGRLKLPKHISRFDSQHEFKVYLELCRMYGEHRIVRQFLIEIIPPGCCYPRGKYWKVDFAITNESGSPTMLAYVEAKGAFLPEFCYILAILEQADWHTFDNLHIVFPRNPLKENHVVKALLDSGCGPNLHTIEELKQLTKLNSRL